MKKFLFVFLMFSVFSSTLMCRMSLCTASAQAATSPCHERTHAGNSGHSNDLMGLVFASDCANIKFQVSDGNGSAVVVAPDHQIYKITYAFLDDALSSSFQYGHQNAIGSPPDHGKLVQDVSGASLILTTQRFLI